MRILLIDGWSSKETGSDALSGGAGIKICSPTHNLRILYKSNPCHLQKQLHSKWWLPAFQRIWLSLCPSRWRGYSSWRCQFKWLRTLCKQVTFLSMAIKCQPTFFILADKCHPGIRSNNEWLSKPNYLCMLRKDKKDICSVFTWRWKDKRLFL